MRTERPHAVLEGRYVLEEELGRSDIGVSWRANDTLLARPVVVKLIRPTLAEDPSFGARFEASVGAASRISHPGLARLLDTSEQDGVRFVVREHVDGESLRDVLDRVIQLEPAHAATIVARTLDALAELHRHGVAHLDLKPANIILSRDGSVRLCDAGIAAAVLGAGVGVASDDLADAATLLFELLTGERPHPGASSARALRPDVPKELDAIVTRAIAGAGFGTAADFASALRQVIDAEPDPRLPGDPDPHPVPARLPAGSRLFRTWIAIPLAVVLVAVVAVAIGLWAGRLELGGPLGIRVERERPIPTPTAVTLAVAGVTAFDPFSEDQTENDDAAPLAADGDRASVWESENYFDADLNKPGVGLVFDLGSSRTVSGFRLITPVPGYRFAVAVGDSPSTLPTALGPTYTATPDMRETIPPAQGRYVFLWCTSVVPTGDGNRIEVAEFKVVGT